MTYVTLSMSGATVSETMNPPPTSDLDQQTIQRAGDVIEFLAKAGGLAGLVWAFIAKVWKPYHDWRRGRMAMLMRDVMKEELGQLKLLIEREDGCADRIEKVVAQVTELFGEHDLLLEVALDNRERFDETNDLLDAIGLTSDRRVVEDRRKEIDHMLDTLSERRKERRRGVAVRIAERADANTSH